VTKQPSQTTQPARDTPGVIAPPPLIFLAFLLVGFLLDGGIPLAMRPASIGALAWWIAAIVIGVVGILSMAAGITNFTRASTPVPTRRPTTALVTRGIHGLTRNPIYVGMFLIYLAIAVAANSLWLAILVVPLALIIRYGVVAREEVYLERKFADAYRDYKSRVRRWI
jgi:protein-S-isoprenylcysteine O-methyltransferase Ste14